MINRFQVVRRRTGERFDAVEVGGRPVVVAPYAPGDASRGVVAAFPPGSVFVVGKDPSAYSKPVVAWFPGREELRKQYDEVR